MKREDYCLLATHSGGLILAVLLVLRSRCCSRFPALLERCFWRPRDSPRCSRSLLRSLLRGFPLLRFCARCMTLRRVCMLIRLRPTGVPMAQSSSVKKTKNHSAFTKSTRLRHRNMRLASNVSKKGRHLVVVSPS